MDKQITRVTCQYFDVFNSAKTNDYLLLPHPLKVLNDLQSNDINHQSMVFVNKTLSTSSNSQDHLNDQWVAMSFRNYPTLIKSAPISKYQEVLNKYYAGINTNTNNKMTKSLQLITLRISRLLIIQMKILRI